MKLSYMGRMISILIVVVIALVAIGLVMLASSSSARAAISFKNPQYYLQKQAVWLCLSIIIAIAVSKFDYHQWKKFAVPLYILSVILLVAVFLPGIGVEAKGSHRWINLRFMNFQPSELVKFTTVICLSTYMERIGRKISNVKEGLLFPLIGLVVFLFLILLEPDFGSTFLITLVGGAIMFVAGIRWRYLLIPFFIGLLLFVIAIMNDPVRSGRVFAFLWPEKYPKVAYHLTQSKNAFISGGAFGTGLGESIQKQFYLPEAHNDFILAIIGEELGVIATIGVLLLFGTILFIGLTITSKAPDAFGKFLAFGITMMIVLQAVINIGVVTGSMPTKGLPLPFISYGGSSLMFNLAFMGLLLNVAMHSDETSEEDEHITPVKDSEHNF